MVELLKEWCQKKYRNVHPQEWNNSLRCRELRIGETRFSVTYMDSEICIMSTSGWNREENWQKIILLAHKCEGKRKW
jgi:hypothetical protein